MSGYFSYRKLRTLPLINEQYTSQYIMQPANFGDFPLLFWESTITVDHPAVNKLRNKQFNTALSGAIILFMKLTPTTNKNDQFRLANISGCRVTLQAPGYSHFLISLRESISSKSRNTSPSYLSCRVVKSKAATVSGDLELQAAHQALCYKDGHKHNHTCLI